MVQTEDYISAVYVLCSIAKYVCAFFFHLFVHVSWFNGGLSQPPQTVPDRCYIISPFLINSPQSQLETKIVRYSSVLVLLFIVQDKKKTTLFLCDHKLLSSLLIKAANVVLVSI